MSDQGNEPKRASTPDDGVLRPFEASEIEPLPPVQPSAVVVPGIGEEPLVEFVEVDVDSGPSRADRSDAWSPGAADEAAWFDTETDRRAGPKDAPSSARPEPGVAGARAGITLPRGPFFVGVGAMVLLAVVSQIAISGRARALLIEDRHCLRGPVVEAGCDRRRCGVSGPARGITMQ